MEEKFKLQGQQINQLKRKQIYDDYTESSEGDTMIWSDELESLGVTKKHKKVTEQKEFRDNLVVHYQDGKGDATCMLTGVSGSNKVKAAHIFPKSKLNRASELFEFKKDEIQSPRNGLLLARRIERAFDKRFLTFVYHPFNHKYYCCVVNPYLASVPIALGASATFATLDGMELKIPSNKPYHRLLRHHSLSSLTKALNRQWKVSQDNADFIIVCEQVSGGHDKADELMDNPEKEESKKRVFSRFYVPYREKYKVKIQLLLSGMQNSNQNEVLDKQLDKQTLLQALNVLESGGLLGESLISNFKLDSI